MRLPEKIRDDFKKPLGKLILDSATSKDTIQREITAKSYLITVGDATTEKLIGFGLMPFLQIVDGQEKRVKREFPSSPETITTLTCNNPAGEITKESIDVIKKALQFPSPVRILVNGEEDLLVIPVCIYAPEGATVMYGQPNEGLVVVQVTTKIKDKTKSLLDLME